MKHQCGFCKKTLHTTYDTDARMFCSINCMIADSAMQAKQVPWYTRMYYAVYSFIKAVWR